MARANNPLEQRGGLVGRRNGTEPHAMDLAAIDHHHGRPHVAEAGKFGVQALRVGGVRERAGLDVHGRAGVGRQGFGRRDLSQCFALDRTGRRRGQRRRFGIFGGFGDQRLAALAADGVDAHQRGALLGEAEELRGAARNVDDSPTRVRPAVVEN